MTWLVVQMKCRDASYCNNDNPQSWIFCLLTQDSPHNWYLEAPSQDTLYYIIIIHNMLVSMCGRTSSVPVVSNEHQWISLLVYWSLELLHCSLSTGGRAWWTPGLSELPAGHIPHTHTHIIYLMHHTHSHAVFGESRPCSWSSENFQSRVHCILVD